jgi:hypothetical protein
MEMRPDRCGVRLLALVLAGCALCGCKDEEKATAASGGTKAPAPAAEAALPTGNGPYDMMARTYAPFTSPDDPVGFPMKVRNLATQSAYRFWRGSKEIFYEWCKTNTADWMADAPAFLRIHGDLHPGNMGLYHSTGKFGRHVAFGAVDFDDSAKLPFQLEFLQGVVTFELLARHRALKLSDAQIDELIGVMMDSYRSSLESDQTPTQLLEEDNWVGKLLKDARKKDYADELSKYVQKDQFVSLITDKSGKIKEVLRPLKGRAAFADAIENALVNSPDGKDLFKDVDIRKKSVEDIARRTQLESAGSEGLHKYLLLVTNKKSPEGKLILYLKEQIPTSAERVGLIAKDPRPPGQRSSEDMHGLSNPPAYFNSWCAWNGGSYRLSIKEPWTETLDGADVNTFEDLKHVARIWGTVAGSIHRSGQITPTIKSRLTPEFVAQLHQRARAYSPKVVDDFNGFRTDARAREQVAKAEAGIKELESKSR